MRLHVLLLLLLALPLRGWVGDAMAMEMARAALQATAAPSTAAAPMADAAMPDDCPMHQAGPAADPAGNVHAGHAGACTLCDVCHGASLADTPAVLGAVVTPHAAPAPASTRFASVLRAPDLRPPIR